MREVYDFVSSPTNLPQWASGLGESVENVGGQWVLATQHGPVNFRFVPRNDLGVLDHYVSAGPGAEVYIPMRVVPNGEGCELLFTLFRPPEMTEEKFKQDAVWVLRDLMKLKSLLEA
jgi:hypothetical protein